MRRSRIALFVVVGMLSAAGCGSRARPTQPLAEPSHRVNYQVSTIGTANGSVEIKYAAEQGADATESWPGGAQVWFKEVHTEPGQRAVTLQAVGNSSDLAFRITCSVRVDGAPAGSQTGSYGCYLFVEFDTVRSAQASRPSSAPPPSSPPVPSSAPPAVPPSTPAACRYVTAEEAATIVSAQAGTYKPVLAVGGDAQKCTYVFDYQASHITFSWLPGGRAQGIPGTEVSGLGVRAYWADYGMFGTFQAQLPKGLFKVDPFFQLLQVDKEKICVELFKVARPRLPRR
jgi:hypothetical protein